jgi:two-component system, sensor histidine kinase and response regulator
MSAKDRVLIVDDNPTNLGLMSEYLTRHNYDVVLSQSGEDALQKAVLERPDIILLDIMMPGIDGFETCRRFKAHPDTRDLPVIFVTALMNTTDKIKGFEAGGVDYITKPFQPEEIGLRVSTHLTIKKLREQLQEQNSQLQQQKDELAELNTNKDKFFSILAHDLRTPLTSLLAYTRFAVTRFDDLSQADLHTMLEDLCNTSENLYALLENLLEWAQIQRGMLTYRLEACDLHDLIVKNLSNFEYTARQKAIMLSAALPDQHLIGWVDMRIVDVVLRNLLSNAIKFTPEHGKVTIEAGCDAEGIEIVITDSGVGLSQATLANLFHIGQSTRHPGTAGELGTGLGQGCDVLRSP